MKSVALDFKNKIVCIMQAGQQGTEYHPTLQKSDFLKYIPEKYRSYDSFTWNFEEDKFAVNREYVPSENCVRTHESFIPQVIIPMPGLNSQFDDFLNLMGYEKVDASELLNEIYKTLLSSDLFGDEANEDEGL